MYLFSKTSMKNTAFPTLVLIISFLYFGSKFSKALESLQKHVFRNITAKNLELLNRKHYV